MTLSDAHTEHIHYIFYQLCQERGWSVGFPTTFDWGYLPITNEIVQARISYDGNKPLIEIHPLAFEFDDKWLVKGLVHHEICHYILGAEVGHGPKFDEFESQWQYYYSYKQSALNFARMLQQNRRFIMTCLHCDLSFVKERPIQGSVCRSCCEKHSKGNYDSRYTLHIGGLAHD